MTSDSAEIKDIITRLCFLERNDVWKTADFRSLQNEVRALQDETSDLRKSLSWLKDQNSTMRRTQALEDNDQIDSHKMESLHSHVTRLKEENASLKQDILQFHRQSSTLRDTIEALEANGKIHSDKIESLHSDVTRLENRNATLNTDVLQFHRQNSTLKNAIDALEEDKKRIGSLKKDLKTLQKENDSIKIEIHQLHGKNLTLEGSVEEAVQQTRSVSRVFSRSLVDLHDRVDSTKRLGVLEQKTDSIEKRTIQIENFHNNVKQSVTMVGVVPRDGLVTGQRVVLDECVGVYGGNGGMWDNGMGKVKITIDGDYSVVNNCVLHDDGEIKMHLRWDGVSGSGSHYCGTVRDNDTLCDVVVMRFTKGDTVWLEAERTKGDADIGWCGFYVWLVSP